MEKREKNKSIIEILTVLMSVAALSVSIYTCSGQKKQFKYLYSDNINITYSKRGKNHTTHYIKGADDTLLPSFFSVEYEVLISNNSSLPISIIDYEIVSDDKIKILGLYKESFVLQEVPIQIEGRESIKLNLNVYYPISVDANIILKKKYSYGTRPVFREFCNEVYRHNLDLVGNDIEYREIDDSWMITLKEEQKYPRKKLLITTSTNKVYESEIPYFFGE